MRGKCSNDSALISLFMNEAGPSETDRLLRHLAACSRCTLRFDFLRQLNRELEPKVQAFIGEAGAQTPEAVSSALRRAASERIQAFRTSLAPPSSSPRTGFFGSLLSLKFAVGFLAVLLVVSTVAYFALFKAPRQLELRSPSLKLTLLAPVGTRSAPPSIFRWTPVLHAEGYVLELIDDSLNRVHRGSTFLITELVLPAEIRSKLVKGRVYVWSISAHDADSNLLTSTSGSFVIE
jgi:hypothetical protein